MKNKLFALMLVSAIALQLSPVAVFADGEASILPTGTKTFVVPVTPNINVIVSSGASVKEIDKASDGTAITAPTDPYNFDSVSNSGAQLADRFNALVGYAFADGFGWISANTTPTDPTTTFGSCISSKDWLDESARPRIDPATGNMTGCLWIEENGWIRLDQLPSTDGNRARTTSTGTTAAALTGYAWGENIGWISLAGTMLDGSGHLTGTGQIIETGSPTPREIAFRVTLQDPVTPAKTATVGMARNMNFLKISGISTATNTSTFGTEYDSVRIINNGKGTEAGPILAASTSHGLYQLEGYATNVYGQVSSGSTIYTIKPSSTGAVTLAGSPTGFSVPKIGDGNDTNSIYFNFRDPIRNSPIAAGKNGIDSIVLTYHITDNVDFDQMAPGGDAIGTDSPVRFSGHGSISSESTSASATTRTITVTGATAISQVGLDFTSFAPTSTTNTFTVSSIDIEINGAGGFHALGSYTTPISLSFMKPITTSSADWNNLSDGVTKTFSTPITNNSSGALVTYPNYEYLLEINNPLFDFINFQRTAPGGAAPIPAGTGALSLTSGIFTQLSGAIYHSIYSTSSLISTGNPTLGSPTFTFTVTPQLIAGVASAVSNSNLLPLFGLRNTNGYNTIYKDDSISASSSVLQALIIGTANSQQGSSIITDTQNALTNSLSREDIKTAIYQNVASLTRNVTPCIGSVNTALSNNTCTQNSVTVMRGDATLTATNLSNKTVIVLSGDLTITGDISGSSVGLIVLADGTPGKGNIYLGNSVKNTVGAWYADGSLLNSGTNLANQWWHKGSLVSSNTIGGATASPLACPAGTGTCSKDVAKLYDLNYTRRYNGDVSTTGQSANVSASWPKPNPIVIEYDPALATTPPAGFTN